MNDYLIGYSTLLLCESRNEEKLREKMSSRKRKILTLEDRVKVGERLSKGESARSIALSVDIGKTQVQTAKEKNDILHRWKDGENGNRQEVRQEEKVRRPERGYMGMVLRIALTEHPHIWRHDAGESRLTVYELWIRLHGIERMARLVESPTQHPVLGP